MNPERLLHRHYENTALISLEIALLQRTDEQKKQFWASLDQANREDAGILLRWHYARKAIEGKFDEAISHIASLSESQMTSFLDELVEHTRRALEREHAAEEAYALAAKLT